MVFMFKNVHADILLMTHIDKCDSHISRITYLYNYAYDLLLLVLFGKITEF